MTVGQRLAPGGRRTSGPDYLAEDRGYETPCWVWQHSLGTRGYGQTRSNGRKVGAHCAYFELHRGPVPAGLVLDHLCRVRACVNPAHLEPVTIAENCRRGRAAKLSAEDVVGMRAARDAGEAYSSIAARYGTSEDNAWNVCTRRSWADVDSSTPLLRLDDERRAA